MDLELKLVNHDYGQQIEEFKNLILANNSNMDGTGNLKDVDVNTFIKQSIDWAKGENLPNGFLPATQYLCVRKSDNQLVGMIQIRHSLNDYLLNYGGHIGYCIAYDQRQKGYGTAQLKLALEQCKNLNLNKVLITCRKENVGSKKCILNNGGIYEDARYEPNRKVLLERYWIDIK